MTALYLNPVFESASNHRYDTADYHRVDPILGTEEEFIALCREARALGIRVLLDGVFSHTGADSRYFDKFSRYDDVGAYESESSPTRRWYTFHGDRDHYECWWGFPTLPNVTELEPSYAAFIAGKAACSTTGPQTASAAGGWTLRTNCRTNSYRILRARLKRNDPDAVLMAKCGRLLQ